MKEDNVSGDEIEGRLRRSLSSVAARTQATNRWDEVAARIEGQDGSGGELDYVTVTPLRERSPRPLAALVAFVAVLAAVFGVASMNAGDGAGSPEDAVEDLFEAIAEEDPIGVLQTIAPSERDVLVPVLERLGSELERLEVASDELDLRSLEGVEAELVGLRMTTTRLSDDYARVEVTGGQLRTDVDLADLPFGPVLQALVARDVDDPEGGAIELAGGELVAVHEDGGWHVGIQASLASAAQDDEGRLPAPDFAGGGIPQRGADSPEAAARQMIEAIYARDTRRMIELTPLAESAALHVWGPTLVAAAGPSSEEVRATIDGLELAVTDGEDGTKVVRATAYRWMVTSEGNRTTVELSDGCLTSAYVDPQTDEPSSHRYCPGLKDPLSAAVSTTFSIMGWGQPPILSVVEHDGQWFVSPGRSIAESAFDAMRTLSRDDALRAARSYLGDQWAVAPEAMWEACGVPRPAVDTPSADGERAYERCLESLPDDYAGPYGFNEPVFFGPLYSSGGEFSESGSEEEFASTTILAPTTTTGAGSPTTAPSTTGP